MKVGILFFLGLLAFNFSVLAETGFVLVISGPSGAGKSVLIERLQADPDLPITFSVSNTTRAPREGEVDGREYNFITVEEFKQRIDAGAFIEWAQVHGNYYGTPKEPIEKAVADGKIIILDIDVQGYETLKRAMPNAPLYSVFIEVPSDQLKERLIKRGKDTMEAINRRCANALAELGKSGNYHLRLDNRNGQLDNSSKTLTQAVRQRFGL